MCSIRQLPVNSTFSAREELSRATAEEVDENSIILITLGRKLNKELHVCIHSAVYFIVIVTISIHNNRDLAKAGSFTDQIPPDVVAT